MIAYQPLESSGKLFGRVVPGPGAAENKIVVTENS